MSRWDSAAMVPKTSELLPEPDTPVKTVSRRFGISTLTSLRLFTRAPSTRIRSWLSAACGAVTCRMVPRGTDDSGARSQPLPRRLAQWLAVDLALLVIGGVVVLGASV